MHKTTPRASIYYSYGQHIPHERPSSHYTGNIQKAFHVDAIVDFDSHKSMKIIQYPQDASGSMWHFDTWSKRETCYKICAQCIGGEQSWIVCILYSV